MSLEAPPQSKTGFPWVWAQWFQQAYIWITRSRPTLGTEQASTSGTAIDFTNIPSWVKKITVMLVGVSHSSAGNENYIIQIGDSGGVETSGYLGTGWNSSPASANVTDGFSLGVTFSAANILHGNFTLTLEDSANNTWTCTGMLGGSDNNRVWMGAGSKSLSDTLTQVRITTQAAATFDAGAINILYE